MALGLSIELSKRYIGGQLEGGPYGKITVQGQYDSVESAEDDGVGAGDYFITSSDNVYGLPSAYLIRNTTFTGYESAAAGAAAVGPNVVFQLVQDNVHGHPAGTCMIVSPDADYNNDTAAGAAGVQIGELYAVTTPNSGKLIKQRIA